MKITEWNVTHLGKEVKLIGADEWHYRLEGLKYDYGRDGVIATLVSIDPSPRSGTVSHYELASIELVE